MALDPPCRETNAESHLELLDRTPFRIAGLPFLWGNKSQRSLFPEVQNPIRLQGFGNYTMVMYHISSRGGSVGS